MIAIHKLTQLFFTFLPGHFGGADFKHGATGYPVREECQRISVKVVAEIVGAHRIFPQISQIERVVFPAEGVNDVQMHLGVKLKLLGLGDVLQKAKGEVIGAASMGKGNTQPTSVFKLGIHQDTRFAFMESSKLPLHFLAGCLIEVVFAELHHAWIDRFESVGIQHFLGHANSIG